MILESMVHFVLSSILEWIDFESKIYHCHTIVPNLQYHIRQINLSHNSTLRYYLQMNVIHKISYLSLPSH